MKDIIPTYSCVVAKEIDNNFYKNEIYIMYKSTYESRKKSIDEAEAIIVWPHVNEQKYINPKYIWKIKSKWNYTIKYNSETKVFEAIDIEGKDKWEDLSFLERLLSVHKRQQKFFNTNLEHLDEGITDRYFIEIQKINSYDNANTFFKEKTLFYLNEYFETNWILIDKIRDFRYFKFNIDKNLFYDIKREMFFWEWVEEVYFTSRTYKDDLNKLIRLLIKEWDRPLWSNEVCDYLWIKIEKKQSSEKLRAIKDWIRDFFQEKLFVDNKTFSSKILIAPWHEWFRLLGKLLTNEEYSNINNNSKEN